MGRKMILDTKDCKIESCSQIEKRAKRDRKNDCPDKKVSLPVLEARRLQGDPSMQPRVLAASGLRLWLRWRRDCPARTRQQTGSRWRRPREGGSRRCGHGTRGRRLWREWPTNRLAFVARFRP